MGNGPFWAKSWPGAFWSQILAIWRLPAAIKTAFWNYWETARFGPNPGREPFGAKFWHFGGFWAAIKTAFWDYWETARFGPNPGREPFGAKFWQFGGFRAASKTAFWDYWETARFGPNPGREPFGAKFWQFGGFRAAIKTAFWDYWETARFGPNPGREPFGAKFWQFGGFWKLLERSWKAPGKLPETAVPLCQARGGQRTPRHKRFSTKDFPSRTLRAGNRFWSL